MTRHRAAVLGSPVAHSRSPLLHRACYRLLGRDECVYDAVEVPAGGLARFWADLDDTWMGVSLTMPLKEEVLPLLAALDPVAAEVGAVNTVVFTDDGPIGLNTDVTGLVQVLSARIAATADAPVVVLGSGATARSALAALSRLGVTEVTIVARDAAAVARLHGRFGGMALTHAPWPQHEALVSAAPLVVSTVPSSAAPRLTPTPGQYLLDVNYPDPPLLRAWQDGGGAGEDGRGLLVQQGVAQALLFTGEVVVAQTLADLVAAAASAVA